MPFQKGQTGNAKGRPKLTAEQKSQSERFRSLLRQATVPALESIIEIAMDRSSRDCLAACRYVIDKAYGTNAIIVMENEPVNINIIRHTAAAEKDDWADSDWE